MIKTYDNHSIRVTKDFLNVIHNDFFRLVKKQGLDQVTISHWGIWSILEDWYILTDLTPLERMKISEKIRFSEKMNEVPKD